MVPKTRDQGISTMSAAMTNTVQWYILDPFSRVEKRFRKARNRGCNCCMSGGAITRVIKIENKRFCIPTESDETIQNVKVLNKPVTTWRMNLKVNEKLGRTDLLAEQVVRITPI